MHHLSIPVSVCTRIKECRILTVALGDRGAVNPWRDPVPGWTGKVYCGWIPLAKSKRSWSTFSEANNLKNFSSRKKCTRCKQRQQSNPAAGQQVLALKRHLKATDTQQVTGIYSTTSPCHASRKWGGNNGQHLNLELWKGPRVCFFASVFVSNELPGMLIVKLILYEKIPFWGHMCSSLVLD